ncbi:hypothetical protein D3C76_1444590 [compost metagenome]
MHIAVTHRLKTAPALIMLQRQPAHPGRGIRADQQQQLLGFESLQFTKCNRLIVEPA